MSINYGELYGPATAGQDLGASPAPLDPASSQVAEYRIARSSPPSAPLSPPFVARSLLIDNATGRWWLIAGRWIPPWTIGAVVPVDPPSSQLEVLAQTPAGQLSEAAGDELLVVARSLPAVPHPGLYTPPASGFALVHARINLTATTSGGPPATHAIAAAPAAGTRYALRRIRAAIDYALVGNRQSPIVLSLGHLNLVATVVERTSIALSIAYPQPPVQTFDPPLVWADPADAAVANAGIHVIARQPAAASPQPLAVEADYLVLDR